MCCANTNASTSAFTILRIVPARDSTLALNIRQDYSMSSVTALVIRFMGPRRLGISMISHATTGTLLERILTTDSRPIHASSLSRRYQSPLPLKVNTLSGSPAQIALRRDSSVPSSELGSEPILFIVARSCLEACHTSCIER